jgi:hypothetical protein
MLCKEVIAVCSENHAELIKTLWENAMLLLVETGGMYTYQYTLEG